MLVKNESESVIKEMLSSCKYSFQKLFKNKFSTPLLVFIFIFCVFIFVSFFLLYANGKPFVSLRNNLQKIKRVPLYFKYLPSQIFHRLVIKRDTISIEIKPADYQLLMNRRQQALQKKTLSDDLRKNINVKLSINDENGGNLSARLRLKGVTPDYHMGSPKWSMRINLPEGKELLGMNRFSLQHPQRRSYIRSFLFHNMMGLEGLVNIDYRLVEVVINGAKMGVYAVEEAPNQSTLTRQKKDGVIVRFDSPVFTEDGISYTDAYYATYVKSYQMNKILNDEVLKGHFLRARDLLINFRQGTLTAKEVFDLESIAKWMSLGDILGAWHGFAWTNLRFYYDPNKDKIQLMGWDGYDEDNKSDIGGIREDRLFRLSDSYMDPQSPFWKELLEDEYFLRIYFQTLDRVTKEDYLDLQLGKISKKVKHYLDVLHCDYPQLSLADEITNIKKNQSYIRKTYLYPVNPFQAYFEGFSNGILTIAFANRKSIPVELKSIYYDEENTEFFPVGGTQILSPRIPGKSPIYEKYKFIVPDFSTWSFKEIDKLIVKNNVIGIDEVLENKILLWKSYDILLGNEEVK